VLRDQRFMMEAAASSILVVNIKTPIWLIIS